MPKTMTEPKSKSLSINVALTILKPVTEVFAAVLHPVPYFVETASGPLEKGKKVRWKFPEMGEPVEVTVTEVVPDKRIRFAWGSGLGNNNICEFKFGRPQDLNPKAPADAVATTISISESGWPDNVKGRQFSYRNTMGWTQMVCALKAYLEYGVNLRKGSFLHMKF